MARSRTSALSVAVALGCTAVAYNLSAAFVGSSPQLRGGPAVARGVGTDYLVRNGPKDADPPAVDTSKAAGATVDIEFKKRPFGIARYVPGANGKGAIVRDVTQKSRYPGDPQGQAFVAGVQPDWVLKSVNGQDVSGMDFFVIMQMLDDEVMDPVTAMSLNLKASGVKTDLRNDGAERTQGEKFAITSDLDKVAVVDMPAKLVYQQM
ncbi:unnamed protein product [Polarella glacialis]|uniref:PDZ domain-containing protein n=1 Tax=Polarella glacialis TaxID=89957 RepID=A0A813G2G8_POLGL|nr:unnamed protein product [Polarella glacialis]CAE8740121.1 unnamed protein product [Polarella glacialis]